MAQRTGEARRDEQHAHEAGACSASILDDSQGDFARPIACHPGSSEVEAGRKGEVRDQRDAQARSSEASGQGEQDQDGSVSQRCRPDERIERRCHGSRLLERAEDRDVEVPSEGGTGKAIEEMRSDLSARRSTGDEDRAAGLDGLEGLGATHEASHHFTVNISAGQVLVLPGHVLTIG